MDVAGSIELPEGVLMVGTYRGLGQREGRDGVFHELHVEVPAVWGAGVFTYNLGFEPGTFGSDMVAKPSKVASALSGLREGDRVIVQARVFAEYSKRTGNPWLKWTADAIAKAPRVVAAAAASAATKERSETADSGRMSVANVGS